MEKVLVEELPKVMTTRKLAELLNCSTVTVLIYLGRAEFSHVHRIRVGRNSILKGIVKQDILSLSNYIDIRKRKTGKLSSCSKKKHAI